MNFLNRAVCVAFLSSLLLLSLSVVAFFQKNEIKYPSGWIAADGNIALTKVNDYPNSVGVLRVLVEDQSLDLNEHPFFKFVAPNGRACVSCHQPSDGMSLSVATIKQVWAASAGKDPIFAAYDGSNCPSLPQQKPESHSLLLEHGLFRIEMPWPPRPRYGEPVTADFTIEVINDPWGCNSSQKYGLSAERPTISVYRRPRPVANLKYLTAVGFAYDPKQGKVLPRDPETNEYLSGNIMADNRSVTLTQQMQDAGKTHLELVEPLNDEQVQQINDFILKVYAAQTSSKVGGSLSAAGALGGPELLRDSKAGQLGSIGRAVWSEFQPWELDPPVIDTEVSEEQAEYRRSVARGARLFRERMFLINDSAGINSPIGFGNPVLNSCVFCHNMSQMGNDVAPGQVDIGTTTMPYAFEAPHLPTFKITCLNEPHPHYGATFFTHDPGYALVSGKCADVGKITIQSMRGLAARAPYFSNGSAADLAEVIRFYDIRYNIGLTEQEKTDLLNLMGAL